MTEAEAMNRSLGTVIIAGIANMAIAVAKAVAGIISGSSAMLSEAAHSIADTTSEVLLFAALRRGARPADPQHPFGHSKERYVWGFLAALLTFVAGAVFSIAHGVSTIRSGHVTGNFLISYIVLAVAFVLDSISLGRASLQIRGEANRWDTRASVFLRLTADTAVTAVFLEDTAGLIGVLFAATGVGLTHLTGNEFWDGAASVAIGMLLIVIAVVLARTNVSLLVGRAVPPRIHVEIHDELSALPTVNQIHTLLTMQLGPDEVIVAAKVDFADDATGADIEAAADEAERRLTERFPMIEYVFLDPTRDRTRRPR